MQIAKIKELATHPIKGLSPHRLEQVTVEVGGTFPLDRAYAIENGPTGFDPANPQHIAKTKFIVLARFANLAGLHCRFDLKTHEIRIFQECEEVCHANLQTPVGRHAVETFFNIEMAAVLSGPAKVLQCDGHSFSDLREKRIHVVNLETVKQLSKETGIHLDPSRFRGNILIEDIPPFSELEWAEKSITSGDVKFRFHKPTKRCAAVDVNPETAERDTKLPSHLFKTHGHMSVGVYLEVMQGGTMSCGDDLVIA
ncbi:MOSC domain-containing protein [Flexibacterium corallicola]|uniref:MOSC domain-containing protein n=1 Tax=Flexibacterium corallicola TaxID=3037259 RepID=UPI00286F6C49|nr:MOSC domain-containing protein [Pseudovibrio sp. M1P-2-3]